MKNEIYALIRLDAKKIKEAKASVNEISLKMKELSLYGDVKYGDSLESLGVIRFDELLRLKEIIKEIKELVSRNAEVEEK